MMEQVHHFQTNRIKLNVGGTVNSLLSSSLIYILVLRDLS